MLSTATKRSRAVIDAKVSGMWSVILPGPQLQVAAITAAARKADRLVLATDPDREGEAISWHLLQELQACTVR